MCVSICHILLFVGSGARVPTVLSLLQQKPRNVSAAKRSIDVGREEDCITLHPGFRDVCLNKYVLEVASLGLKTKAGKRYRTIYVQGQKSENE